MEEPYIPFYKPYGMSEEEYEEELRLAYERHTQWLDEQVYNMMVHEGLKEQAEQFKRGFIQTEEDELKKLNNKQS